MNGQEDFWGSNEISIALIKKPKHCLLNKQEAYIPGAGNCVSTEVKVQWPKGTQAREGQSTAGMYLVSSILFVPKGENST